MFGVVPGQRVYSTYVGEGGGGSETVGELGGWGGPGSLITQPQRLPLILSPFFSSLLCQAMYGCLSNRIFNIACPSELPRELVKSSDS